MRKIEKEMINALKARTNLYKGNTMVHYYISDDVSDVLLHGNHIATYYHSTGELEVNKDTLACWPTPTTKSRLRALGANVTTKNYVTYLDDKAVN